MSGGSKKRGSVGSSGLRDYRGPDGTAWRVEVRMPGASNAMVMFHHPDPIAGLSRYAWYITSGPEARDVQARLSAQQVLDSLGDADVRRLFRKSMAVSRGVPRLEPNFQTSRSDQLDLADATADAKGMGPILDATRE